MVSFAFLYSDSVDAYEKEEEEEEKADEATSVNELKEVICGLWEQIDLQSRLNASQKETIKEQALVIEHQHQMILSSSSGRGPGSFENQSQL